MIDKETWKIGTERDKMKKWIKYHMHVQYHKKHLFKKETKVQITRKASTKSDIEENCFFNQNKPQDQKIIKQNSN